MFKNGFEFGKFNFPISRSIFVKKMSDSDDTSYVSAVADVVVKRKQSSDTTSDTIKSIISFILNRCSPKNSVMTPARGAITEAAKKFDLSKQAISRFWVNAKKNNNNPNIEAYRASPKKKGRRHGEHLKWNRAWVEEAISLLPTNKRQTLRAISAALGIPKSSIQMMHQNDNIIKKLNNQLKPVLTEHNKVMRVLYAIDKINDVNNNTGRMTFDPSLFEVHVDEKWFFLTKKDQRYYITESEKKATRRTKNKLHITKVMFLTAVARPRFDNDGNCTFDGKIGMWPIVKTDPAQRRSNNRARGTLVTKPINVNYQVYIYYIINRVLPAIKSRFPRNHNNNITIGIQHDNAPTHFSSNDENWQAAINNEAVWKFKLNEQPANSPDTNILDLGFFASIQAIQWEQEPATSINGLIANVLRAWDLYNPMTLERVWLTHQAVCSEIIAANGDNDYDLPHIGKDKLIKDNGKLPLSIDLTKAAEVALDDMDYLDIFYDDDSTDDEEEYI
jgi:hypothetical protein